MWTKRRIGIMVNNLLLLSGFSMIVSGLVLQAGFHIGGAGRQFSPSLEDVTFAEQQVVQEAAASIWNISHEGWSVLHKCFVVIFLVFMIFHLVIHWSWYVRVISKRTAGKHRQIFILSALFVLVTLTGLIPWGIDLLDGLEGLRFVFIEIHDKLALFFTIYLVEENASG